MYLGKIISMDNSKITIEVDKEFIFGKTQHLAKDIREHPEYYDFNSSYTLWENKPVFIPRKAESVHIEKGVL